MRVFTISPRNWASLSLFSIRDFDEFYCVAAMRMFYWYVVINLLPQILWMMRIKNSKYENPRLVLENMQHNAIRKYQYKCISMKVCVMQQRRYIIIRTVECMLHAIHRWRRTIFENVDSLLQTTINQMKSMELWRLLIRYIHSFACASLPNVLNA